MKWTKDETVALLNIVAEMKIMDILDKPRQRNRTIFDEVEKRLRDQGVEHSW